MQRIGHSVAAVFEREKTAGLCTGDDPVPAESGAMAIGEGVGRRAGANTVAGLEQDDVARVLQQVRCAQAGQAAPDDDNVMAMCCCHFRLPGAAS